MTAPTLTAYNVDAERALLGVLIGAPQLAEPCSIRPGDLDTSHGHPEILSAILAVHERTGSADPVLLVEELRRRDQLSRIGEAARVEPTAAPCTCTTSSRRPAPRARSATSRSSCGRPRCAARSTRSAPGWSALRRRSRTWT
jgi:hypothetical protein